MLVTGERASKCNLFDILVLINSLIQELIFFNKLVTILNGREFLLECASKAGVDGAAEFLRDTKNGVNEVFSFFLTYSWH